MTDHPRTIWDAIHSPRWESCSSEGKSSFSWEAAFEVEVEAESCRSPELGREGTRGTGGFRKERNEELRGFGRRLR